MREKLEFPRLSLNERQRRWDLVRGEMRKAKLDCLVLFGWPAVWDFCIANARYLSPIGGNAEFNVLVFPLEGEPTTFVQMFTFVDGWKRSQEWVSDVRPRKGTWADSVVGRVKELGLQGSRIGIDGLAGPLDPDGWVPYSVLVGIKEKLPGAEFVALDDMIEKIRAVKSPEEIAALDKAAVVGDLMLQACADTARPGVKECEVYAKMMETMLANGGEEPTLFFWNCDRNPYPHPFRLPTTRPIEKGDVIVIEMHPKLAGYGYYTHVERTFSLGQPEPKRQEIYDGCLAAFKRGLELFGPGKKITETLHAVGDVIKERKLGICETGIHGHGLASLEYPKYRLHNMAADQGIIRAIGDEFRPGMVFAFSVDLFDPAWQNGQTGCVVSETVEITATGSRWFHKYPFDLHVIKC